jgi:hypothetical protein
MANAEGLGEPLPALLYRVLIYRVCSYHGPKACTGTASCCFITKYVRLIQLFLLRIKGAHNTLSFPVFRMLAW